MTFRRIRKPAEQQSKTKPIRFDVDSENVIYDEDDFWDIEILPKTKGRPTEFKRNDGREERRPANQIDFNGPLDYGGPDECGAQDLNTKEQQNDDDFSCYSSHGEEAAVLWRIT